MGFFNRLFRPRSRSAGKISAQRLREIETLQPHSLPMSADKYWLIVSRSLKKTRTMEEQRQKLLRLVGKLKCGDIMAFHLRTLQLLRNSYNEDLWCAAYLIEGGCDAEAFEYFRCWLISCGQRIYENALRDPDSLLALLDRVEDHSFESFYYVPEEAFMQVTGKSMFDYLKQETTNASEELHMSWSSDNPDSMRHICPGLFRKYFRD